MPKQKLIICLKEKPDRDRPDSQEPNYSFRLQTAPLEFRPPLKYQDKFTLPYPGPRHPDQSPIDPNAKDIETFVYATSNIKPHLVLLHGELSIEKDFRDWCYLVHKIILSNCKSCLSFKHDFPYKTLDSAAISHGKEQIQIFPNVLHGRKPNIVRVGKDGHKHRIGDLPKTFDEYTTWNNEHVDGREAKKVMKSLERFFSKK